VKVGDSGPIPAKIEVPKQSLGENGVPKQELGNEKIRDSEQ
jgi:hypothetical protein